ncbi:unnamed protein product [Choristocarpus tenellus]
MRSTLSLKALVAVLGCSVLCVNLTARPLKPVIKALGGVTTRPALLARVVGTHPGWGTIWAGPRPFKGRCLFASLINGPAKEMKNLERRIYDIAGREFDIGKPTQLAKVLYEEVGVSKSDIEGTEVGKEINVRSRAKSVSTATLQTILGAQSDMHKRELISLVLKWLQANALSKRGGFKALGARVVDVPDWRSKLIPDGEKLPSDPSSIPLVLIDGHYLIFRSYHAMPQLTSPDGTPVGALVGFCNVLNKLIVQPWVEGGEPERRVVVTFDSGGVNFRHRIYPGYKGDRKEVPEDLHPQFSLIREACEAYGLRVVDQSGFEADDVIASLAAQAVTSGSTNVTVVSADKDLAQLVTQRVSLLNAYTGERLGPEEVLSKYLVPPGRIADMLAIVGDPADSIRGADGYGPVNAAKVLAKHSTLNEAVEEIRQTLSRRKGSAFAEEQMDKVLLARAVVELRTDAFPPREVANLLSNIDAFEIKDPSTVLSFLTRHGLADLARRTSRLLMTD